MDGYIKTPDFFSPNEKGNKGSPTQYVKFSIMGA